MNPPPQQASEQEMAEIPQLQGAEQHIIDLTVATQPDDVEEPAAKRQKFELGQPSVEGQSKKKDKVKALVPGTRLYDHNLRKEIRQGKKQMPDPEDKVEIPLRSCVDERLLNQQKFLNDDNFVKKEEFKDFLRWHKVEQLKSQLLVDGKETITNDALVALQTYDPEIEDITPEDARKLVLGSGILLAEGWDLASAFVIDQIRKKPDLKMVSEV